MQTNTATKSRRALRVGVLLDDSLVEERLFSDRKTITLGQSHRNSIAVPIDELPGRLELFIFRAGHYHLRTTPQMKGRVTVGGRVRTIAEVRARESGGLLSLDASTRGRLEIGELRLLFQSVAAPKRIPRPRLPASVRGSLSDRIDPRLAVVLALSLLIHAVVGIAAFLHDGVIERPSERRQTEFRASLYEPEMPIPQASAVAAVGTNASSEAIEPEPSVDNRDRGPKAGSSSEGGEPDEAALEEAIAGTALMQVLGAGEGGRYDRSQDIDQGAGLNQSINDIRDSQRNPSAQKKDDEGRARDGGKPRIARDRNDGLEEAQGGGETKKKVEEEIESRHDFGENIDEGPPFLDPKVVADRIRKRYVRGIKVCHVRAIKKDETIGGRVQLRFTVGASGKTTRSSASGFDATVDLCIEAQMKRWRFPAPKDGDKPAATSFSIPVVLRVGR